MLNYFVFQLITPLLVLEVFADENKCLNTSSILYRPSCKGTFTLYVIMLLNRYDPDEAYRHIKLIQPMLEPCMRLEEGNDVDSMSNVQFSANATNSGDCESYYTFTEVHGWTELPETEAPLFSPFSNYHWGSNDLGLLNLLNKTIQMEETCDSNNTRQPIFLVLTDMDSAVAADKFLDLPRRVLDEQLRLYNTLGILMRIIWTKPQELDPDVLAFMERAKRASLGYIDYAVDDLSDARRVAIKYGLCAPAPPDPPTETGIGSGVLAVIIVGGVLLILMILLVIIISLFAFTNILNRPAYQILRFLERRLKIKFDFLVKLHQDLADEGFDRYVKEYNRGQDDWEIDPKDLHISTERLGSGAFAEVYKGILIGSPPVVHIIPQAQLIGGYARDENAVAIKKPYDSAGAEERIEFLHEIRFMKTLDFHPHVLTMLGCYIYPLQPLIITELCELGDLLSLVRQLGDPKTKSESPIDSDVLPVITWQICDALSFLATKNIIHRDVAARNVLITSGKVAKLSDFGLCRKADDLMYSSKRIGKLPLKWMAPESIEKAEYSHKSDMWSYGILLYEVFSYGTVPYPSIESEAVLEFVKKGNRPEVPDETPEYVATLMMQCWSLKPSDRTNASVIKSLLYSQIEATITGDGYLQVKNYVSFQNQSVEIHSKSEKGALFSEYEEVPGEIETNGIEIMGETDQPPFELSYA